MEDKITLVSMFESNRYELERELENLVLPQDATKIQSAVMNILNTMFEGNGEYRQNLTQSEDYILVAAIELLNAQQDIAREITAGMETKSDNVSHVSKNKNKRKGIDPYLMAGAITGATIGITSGVLLDTWKAIFCAIAGTAVVIYGSSLCKTKSVVSENVSHPINVQIFMGIIKNICGKIDDLIETYRVQVKRVKNMCEKREKPSLQKDYPLLLQAIQELVVIEQNTNESDKRIKRVEKKIAELPEILENYGLAIINGKITEIR